MALNPRQKRFVDEYLIDLNATQAAVRAGYSKKRADKTGSELRRKPCVAEVIQEEMQKRELRTAITQDRVLKELEKVAFAEAADHTNAPLKFSSKLKALELLGKHLSLFSDKVEHDHSGTITIELGGELAQWAK